MPIGLIVAAGRGVRMGADRPKQFLELAGRPILAHVVKAFDRASAIDRIVLVLPSGDRERCRRTVLASLALDTPLEMVCGGSERQVSVSNGLAALGGVDESEVVLIHDGVRPFVEPGGIDRCVATALACGSCVPVLALTETVKRVDADGFVTATVDREVLRLAQTPQAFRLGLIRAAHDAARRNGLHATDDASLVEALGERVRTVTGDRFNLKITTAEDLALAHAVLACGLWPRPS